MSHRALSQQLLQQSPRWRFLLLQTHADRASADKTHAELEAEDDRAQDFDAPERILRLLRRFHRIGDDEGDLG